MIKEFLKEYWCLLLFGAYLSLGLGMLGFYLDDWQWWVIFIPLASLFSIERNRWRYK